MPPGPAAPPGSGQSPNAAQAAPRFERRPTPRKACSSPSTSTSGPSAPILAAAAIKSSPGRYMPPAPAAPPDSRHSSKAAQAAPRFGPPSHASESVQQPQHSVKLRQSTADVALPPASLPSTARPRRRTGQPQPGPIVPAPAIKSSRARYMPPAPAAPPGSGYSPKAAQARLALGQAAASRRPMSPRRPPRSLRRARPRRRTGQAQPGPIVPAPAIKSSRARYMPPAPAAPPGSRHSPPAAQARLALGQAAANRRPMSPRRPPRSLRRLVRAAEPAKRNPVPSSQPGLQSPALRSVCRLLLRYRLARSDGRCRLAARLAHFDGLVRAAEPAKRNPVPSSQPRL